jgi:sulfonate transport system substrate-binding protein
VVVRRRTFRLRPINSSLIAEQQRIADLFYNEKVIPRRIAIKDSVLTSQQYAAITPRRISRK